MGPFLMVMVGNLPKAVQEAVHLIESDPSPVVGELKIRTLFTHSVLGFEFEEDLADHKTGQIKKFYLERAKAISVLVEGFTNCVNLVLEGMQIKLENQEEVVFHSGHYASQLVIFIVQEKEA